MAKKDAKHLEQVRYEYSGGFLMLEQLYCLRNYLQDKQVVFVAVAAIATAYEQSLIESVHVTLSDQVGK